ncbi:hypothetical protein LJK87_20485 [Paenibacillus sp. P25]|nr:hypothetical protein LJK87_20485 [Paenibacillus sp. P25]
MWVKQCFLALGEAREGEKITITFPVSERQTVEKAVGQQFVAQWRGDDVIRLSPEGRHHPFYSDRKVYDKAPMREGDYRRLEQEFYW